MILPIAAFRIARVIIEEVVMRVDILMIIIIGPNFCSVDIMMMFIHLMLFNT